MKYRCIKTEEFEHWLKVKNIYEGHVATEFIGGTHLEILKADDGHRCFALKKNFERIPDEELYGLEIGS